MVWKTAVMKSGAGMARIMLCLLAAFVLAASMVPSQAFAYYNRGSVSVAVGAAEVDVQAGATASVTVSITPASDDQAEGCGMPKCPQGCSSTCADANGQCQCSGKEYKTYRPTAVVSSSNAGVAIATYSGNALTVYGKSEGEAIVTVRASLRQFTDAETTLRVKVSGTADGQTVGSTSLVEVPEGADALQDDKLDLVEKTVMGRLIHNVRINDSVDAVGRLAEMAGIDGDVIFWKGDTYYHPDYSLTFAGTDYAADDVAPIDVRLEVGTEAQGTLNQPLDGVDGFVVVDFAQKGELCAPATVYASAGSALSDGETVALFSYDETAKTFMKEDEAPSISGGYAVFSTQVGKTYVVSSHDLTTETKAIVTGGAAAAGDGGSCCDPVPAASDANGSSCSMTETMLPPVVPLALGIGVVAGGIAVAVVMAVRRRKVAGKGSNPPAAPDGAGHPSAPSTPFVTPSDAQQGPKER